MTDVDYRQWLYDVLHVNGPLVAVIPATSMFARGSVDLPPLTKPFLVIAVGVKVPELNDGGVPASVSQTATIWVHDVPGSYKRIDACLTHVRNALVGRDDVLCEWVDDSDEFANDDYKTIVRNTSFRMVGGS